MKIELIDLTEDNVKECFELKVASNQMQYIASNEDSWKTAKENGKVARPFAIYCDGRMVRTIFAYQPKKSIQLHYPCITRQAFVIRER